MANKPGTISTVKDFGQYFHGRLLVLTTYFDEAILVFDTYKAHSLTQKSREKRPQGIDPIQYLIADDTNIKHIPMGRFLSHEKTKADITEYFAQAVLKNNANSQTLFITSTSGRTRSNRGMQFQENNHERIDTLLLCLAAAASQRCPKAQMVFFSPDIDVLVLAVAHYDKLCKHTGICTVSGTLEIEPIWSALGQDKAAALPVFFAYTGVDNVGWFSGLGKTKWFQQYMKVDRHIISALMKLTEEGDITQEVKDALASFVCLLYCPKGIHITSFPDLRWHLFCKHLAESNTLPPTVGVLEEHIAQPRGVHAGDTAVQSDN